MSETADEVLRRVFGHAGFRGPQGDVVDALVRGEDCLVLMPTGAGKSVCYQVPALLRDGTAIVVSPLIALMQDQVDALAQLGVRAAFLNSSLSAERAAAVERALLAGELDLLYVAPERLLTERFLSLLDRARIALFAIDEAHCVSQWGHDFRPEYRALNLLHERWPAVPRIALTATADPPTRREIAERLDLVDARWFVTSFDRPNIRYTVVQKGEPRRQLLDFLGDHAGEAGIVYCLSRRKVDETAEFLQRQGFAALPYHAGMDAGARAENQRRFLREDGVVMVATIAFGMGIDKPDVRFVAHMDLPKSIEGYYQETGRAGRDGAPAQAWLCYGLGDVVQLRRMIESGEASEERRWLERRKLDTLLGYCESARCRRQTLLAAFGEALPDACGNCDTCLQPPRTIDGTVLAQKAMSTVYRTGQRFGVVHLTNVLRGVDSERMQQLGHDGLSVFGVGADTGESHWKSVFRQLVALGLLDVDVEGHGVLRLTAASRAVLKGEQTVALREEPAPVARARARRRRGSAGTPANGGGRVPAAATLDDGARRRFEALRAMRTELAREQSVPPYVIFHDATLAQIADGRPESLDDLAGISGVGGVKLERYGERVLATLRADAEGATLSPS